MSGLLVVSVACGGDDGIISPGPVAPSVLTSIAVVGYKTNLTSPVPLTIRVGETAYVKVHGTDQYAGRDLTSQATVQYNSNGGTIRMDVLRGDCVGLAPGRCYPVIGLKPGTASISASFEGLSHTLNVTVTP